MKISREGSVTEYITDALLLLLKKVPYNEISVTALCDKAGVTRMSFYRNFNTKEDVLEAWISSITEDFLRDSRISYKNDSPRQYFTKLFTHMKKHADICLAIYNAGLIYLVKDEFDHIFLTLHKDEYDEYKSYFLAGGIYNIFFLWLIRGCKESPQQLASKLDNILER